MHRCGRLLSGKASSIARTVDTRPPNTSPLPRCLGVRPEDVLVGLLQQHGVKLAIIQAGIGDVVARAVRETKGGESVLATTPVFAHPNEVRQEYVSGTPDETESLRDLALRSAQAICEESDAAVAIAIISLPDVNEDADIVEGTAVAVYSDTKVRDRVYGFGAQSEVARDWVRSWSLSSAWRMLKERFDAD